MDFIIVNANPSGAEARIFHENLNMVDTIAVDALGLCLGACPGHGVAFRAAVC